MNELELTAKRDSMKKWLSIGGVVGGAVLAGVFYMLLVQAFVGVVALAGAAVLGYSAIAFAPAIALKIANAKYRMIENEKVSHIKKVAAGAAENPIETLQNLLIQKNQAIKRFEVSVIQAVTARETFNQKTIKFAKQYPARAAEFQRQLENMTVMVDKKKTALNDAKASLQEGANKLEEMKAYWEMSQAAQALNKAAGMDTGDAFEQLKADTACDAVFESMSRAFAELEVAASLDVEVGQQSISHNPSDVLEVEVRNVTQKVRV